MAARVTATAELKERRVVRAAAEDVGLRDSIIMQVVPDDHSPLPEAEKVGTVRSRPELYCTRLYKVYVA